MSRICSIACALILMGSFSAAQAAPVSTLFSGTFTTLVGPNFLPAPVAGAPFNFNLYMTFADGGVFSNGVLRHVDGTLLATVDTGNASWSIFNGTPPAVDQLDILALTNAPGARFLSFSLQSPGTAVTSNSVALGDNMIPFLQVGAILPQPINFVNFLGQGYQGTITAVPEPTTMGLLLCGVAGVAVWHRRRRKNVA